ncbi:VOC family protein [Herbiconiux sp. KACC 21604]|uniref:VOC family protein n=1 Tax=unclassified Herbiconiux TaxID=2618217 RepID=UPI001492B20A|nr:VOC family protein [Herbiconiux sp. SALV-R1]QJU55647.1 VOC family protein [Herbiconiux sp. SALV-R1]WPO86847.1 VOC family protein [Herbiconiux sp. KACC 21604]
MLFDFGQPTDGVIQLAFVVPDLEQAMAEYSARLSIGPWTVFRDFAGHDPRYHGEPTEAVAHVALGFGGHLQYELIQPADDLPSVHRDVIADRGYGFHHFGVATTTFDASVAEYVARGYPVVFSASVDPQSRVAYFDTRDVLPGMTELIEASESTERAFTRMFAASASRQLSV